MTNPVIPDEAVEAAAKARYEIGFGSWEAAHPDTRAVEIEDMCAALEAAAPHMLATVRPNVSRDEMFDPHACLENGGRHEVYISGGPELDTVTYCRRCGAIFDDSERPTP